MHPAAHSEMLSPEAAAHALHAGARLTSPIESAGAVMATDDELRVFLRDAARLHASIMQDSLDKLRAEDVFVVSDLQMLHELGGLSRSFTAVTTKKIADALDGHAAAGASLAETAVGPLLLTPARRAADHELLPRFQPEPSRAATPRAHHG